MKNNRVYLDTNVVADIIDSSRKNHKISLDILEYLVVKNYKICVSEDMLSTLYYILENKKETLECFLNLIFVDWEIVSFGMNTIKEATKLALSDNLDLEDALQCLCAKENKCAILITNDKKFYKCGLEIVSSNEFLKEIKRS